MAKKEPTVLCKTPTPGKKPTRITKWKYDAVRTAILRVVPSTKQGVEFQQLPELVDQALSERERKNLGSVMWYTVTVKLDMEVRGELERVAGVKPQRLRRRC